MVSSYEGLSENSHIIDIPLQKCNWCKN